MFNNQKTNHNNIDAKFKEMYASALQKAKTPPDGIYVVQVKAVKFEDNSDNKKLFRWKLEITDGEHRGKILYKTNTITESDNSLNQLINDLIVCHCKVDSIYDLNDDKIKNYLVGIVLKVEVINGGKYCSVYFKNLIYANEIKKKTNSPHS